LSYLEVVVFESDSHQVVTQTCLGEEMVRFSLSR